jgi:hypothetical protein
MELLGPSLTTPRAGSNLYAGAINRDHVHMLISIPPQLSVSRAIYRDMWEAESALDVDLADPAEALAHIVLSMPLTLRRTGLSRDSDANDWVVIEDGKVIDRIYEDQAARAAVRCASAPVSEAANWRDRLGSISPSRHKSRPDFPSLR